MRRTLLVLGLSLSAAFSASANTYVVAPDGSGDFPTIQAALDAVVAGDVIELADGIFRGAGNRDLDYRGKSVTVRSQSGSAQTCVIDCEGTPATPRRGFIFHSGEGAAAVLAGVTIRNGFQFDFGGGVLCTNAAPRFAACTFLNNGAPATSAGGGLACFSASPALSDCVFEGNRAQSGGGLFCNAGSPTLTGCVFTANVATTTNGYGGGVFGNAYSSPELTACVFTRNAADRGGAAGFRDHSDPALVDCTFSENSAANGGGFYWEYICLPTLTECTLWDNTAMFYGGAMWCGASSPDLQGCTLAANAAGTAGGGLHLYQSSPSLSRTIIAFSSAGEAVYCYDGGSSPTLACCDVYGNSGGDWVGCIAAQAGSHGNIGLDPLFCDAGLGDFRLDEDSPCAPFSPPNPECDLIGAWAVGCASGVAESETGVPALLGAPFPNPFRAETRVALDASRLPAGTRVRLAVFDLAGRRVRTLANGRAEGGWRTSSWDATDDGGEPLESGVYFLRLSAAGLDETRRVVLLRPLAAR